VYCNQISNTSENTLNLFLLTYRLQIERNSKNLKTLQNECSIKAILVNDISLQTSKGPEKNKGRHEGKIAEQTLAQKKKKNEDFQW